MFGTDAEHISKFSSGKQKDFVKKGDRVLVNGAALDREGGRHYPVYSAHNGIYNGKRYFVCPRGHGAMVTDSDVKPLTPAPRKWPLKGNEIFPGYEDVKKRRKLREQKIKEAEEKFRKEYEMKRRAQMERFLKPSSPFTNLEKDCLTERHSQAFLDDFSIEDQQLKQIKKSFGGGEKAERMAHTLLKLRRAFEEGRAITLGSKD